jgi:hypothetical protein
MLGNLQIRTLLDSIVSEKNAENWWRPELFEKNTRTRLPESLVVLSTPPEEDRNYNCFVFAFDLQEQTPLIGTNGWEYTRSLDRVVDRLIQDGILEKLPISQAGALVVYRTRQGLISHVGRITSDGKVISKWSWGPLLEHAIYDVPASYGDAVEYYTNVAGGKAVILKDFSRILGG